MNRRYTILALAFLCLVLFAVIVLLSQLAVKHPKVLWHKTYLQGGLLKGQRHPASLHLLGQDRLLESELITNPAIYDFDGREKWGFRPGQVGEVAMRTVTGLDGSLYIGTNKNQVYAIDPAGQLRWNISVPGTKVFMCCPAVAPDGTVYATSSDTILYKISAAGQIRWRKAFSRLSGRSSPAIGPDGTVYAASRDLELVAITPDGKEKWRTPRSSIGLAVPVPTKSGLIICDRGIRSYLSAYRSDGTLAWKYNYTSDPMAFQPYVDSDGTTYLAAAKGNSTELQVVDPAGKMVWSAPCGNMFAKFCISAKGEIWMIGTNYNLPSTPPSAFLQQVALFTQELADHVRRSDRAKVIILDHHGQVLRQMRATYMFSLVPPVPMPDNSVLVLGADGELYDYSL